MAARDPVDTAVDGEIDDRISGLPDDVLLDILGRLVLAGDVLTVARPSVLSQRWRSLPWWQITNVLLDMTNFSCLLQDQQDRAMAGFTNALEASKRVIGTLNLKFIVTRLADSEYDARRIGVLLGDAADTGRVKDVELEIAAMKKDHVSFTEAPTMLGYGEWFLRRFLQQDFPGAFRCLTGLALWNMWFRDPADLNGLVRNCDVLEFLSLKYCGFLCFPESENVQLDEYADPPPVLFIDAPRSRLKSLVCDACPVHSVALVQAPALESFYCNWLYHESTPVSFGCTPSLKSLSLHHHLFEDEDARWKLSDILVNAAQIESLLLVFGNMKIWLQPERPAELRPALGRLKELRLMSVSHDCNLSWILFILEAAPLLETIDIHIFDHIRRAEQRKQRTSNADLAWQPASPEFRHRNLKKLSVDRTFNVLKDLPFAGLSWSWR